MDLLGLVKDQLSSAIVGKIGTFLGESPEKTSAALGGAMPAILSGLMQKASTTQGAGDILNMIKTGGHDGSMLENLGGLFGGGNATTGLVSAGSSILSSLFGNKVSAVSNIISSVSGIGSTSASSLLSMAAPILMGVLGKNVTSQGMGVSGLANMLMGQKDAVKAALPAGMDKIVDVNGLGDFLGSAKTAAASAAAPVINKANDVVEEAEGGMGKWLPWILGALLLGGALFYFKSCRNVPTQAAAAIDSTAVKVDSAASSMMSGIKKKLSTGVELSFGKKSIENDLIGFIEDSTLKVDKTSWFNFRDLKFKTGSAEIDSTSMQEVKNISEILKAFPNVIIKVGGYTDNVGKPAENLKLSQARANNVMAALIKIGTNAKQIEKAEGYGQEHPVATNDTEEGRLKTEELQ